MKALSTRHWTDWVGTFASVGLGVSLWFRAPEFGLLVLPVLLQDMLVAASFLLRGRPRLQAPGLTSRIVAYVNTFVVLVFVWIGTRSHPEWLSATPVSGVPLGRRP